MEHIDDVVKGIAQPKGGLIPLEDLSVTTYDDGKKIYEMNLPPHIVSITVRSLARQWMGIPYHEVFHTASEGMLICEQEGKIKSADEVWERLYEQYHDEVSDRIAVATQLAMYHTVVRGGIRLFHQVPLPDDSTRKDIGMMTNRTVKFLRSEGPIRTDVSYLPMICDMVDGMTVDVLTRHGAIFLSLSSKAPSRTDILKAIITVLSGIRYKGMFEQTYFIIFYNPKLNQSWKLPFSSINQHTMDALSPIIKKYRG